MATADSRTTAAAVARKLGLDAFEAEVLPASKVEVVKRLQAGGRIVAPPAAGVLYPIFGLLLSPMIAAAAMSFSSCP